MKVFNLNGDEWDGTTGREGWRIGLKRGRTLWPNDEHHRSCE